jgi:hypothetical protein
MRGTPQSREQKKEICGTKRLCCEKLRHFADSQKNHRLYVEVKSKLYSLPGPLVIEEEANDDATAGEAKAFDKPLQDKKIKQEKANKKESKDLKN